VSKPDNEIYYVRFKCYNSIFFGLLLTFVMFFNSTVVKQLYSVLQYNYNQPMFCVACL